MTPEERVEKIEKNLAGLQDQVIITNRLLERAEQHWLDQTADLFDALGATSRAIKRTNEAVEHLAETVQTLADHQSAIQEAVEHLAETVQSLADQQSATQAALGALIATVDRFVKGQSGNGQGGGKT